MLVSRTNYQSSSLLSGHSTLESSVAKVINCFRISFSKVLFFWDFACFAEVNSVSFSVNPNKFRHPLYSFQKISQLDLTESRTTLSTSQWQLNAFVFLFFFCPSSQRYLTRARKIKGRTSYMSGERKGHSFRKKALRKMRGRSPSDKSAQISDAHVLNQRNKLDPRMEITTSMMCFILTPGTVEALLLLHQTALEVEEIPSCLCVQLLEEKWSVTSHAARFLHYRSVLTWTNPFHTSARANLAITKN